VHVIRDDVRITGVPLMDGDALNIGGEERIVFGAVRKTFVEAFDDSPAETPQPPAAPATRT